MKKVECSWRKRSTWTMFSGAWWSSAYDGAIVEAHVYDIRFSKGLESLSKPRALQLGLMAPKWESH